MKKLSIFFSILPPFSTQKSRHSEALLLAKKAFETGNAGADIRDRLLRVFT